MKKSQQYHLYLSMVSLFQTYVKKQIFSINFLLFYAVLTKVRSHLKRSKTTKNHLKRAKTICKGLYN